VLDKAFRILYVDDEPDNIELFRLLFESDFRVLTASCGAEALEILQREPVAVLLSDERMPQMSGIELLARAWEQWPDMIRVIVSAYSDSARLLGAINRGHAHEYLLKPWNQSELRACIERSLAMAERRRHLTARAERLDVLEEDLRARSNPAAIVAESGPMRAILQLAERVAASDSVVLIRGETGTGKELVARFIHERSTQRSGPFVAVNCGALAEGVLESELFGHEAGAFTGAVKLRRGRFELAAGGTLFLDEVGELSPKLQVTLLRVLQERVFERVGGSTTIPMNARLVAATNRSLETMVEEKKFREDLYYRLSVIPLAVPTLRERPQDIGPLIEHFIAKWAPSRRARLDAAVIPALVAYGWPGNVRELENMVQRAVVLSQDGVLTVDDFSFRCAAPSPVSVREELRSTEAAQLRELMLFHGGNCTRAAAALGIPRTTLMSRLKKYDL
jgi:DNA-binding NtrC family response regulator